MDFSIFTTNPLLSLGDKIGQAASGIFRNNQGVATPAPRAVAPRGASIAGILGAAQSLLSKPEPTKVTQASPKYNVFSTIGSIFSPQKMNAKKIVDSIGDAGAQIIAASGDRLGELIRSGNQKGDSNLANDASVPFPSQSKIDITPLLAAFASQRETDNSPSVALEASKNASNSVLLFTAVGLGVVLLLNTRGK